MPNSFTPPAMPANEAERQAAVLSSGLLDPDAGARLQDVVARARAALGANMAALTIITGDKQVLIAADGLQPGTTDRSTSFCGHAILHPQEVMIVPDATRDRRLAGNPFVEGEPHIRFYAGAPLLTATGHALGTLCVFDSAPRDGMTMRETRELRQMATRVMALASRG